MACGLHERRIEGVDLRARMALASCPAARNRAGQVEHPAQPGQQETGYQGPFWRFTVMWAFYLNRAIIVAYLVASFGPRLAPTGAYPDSPSPAA